ncbi:MAG: VanZ family protein [Candidatus Omnitrophica bacterium]|nr:VanZ family protein [Candidatus Omnitrophota bacterium]
MIRGKTENKTHKNFYLYWLPVIVWAILIFALSSFSTFPKAVQPLFSFDKLAHAAEYSVLSFLLARAFKNSKKYNSKRYFRVLAVICAIVYAMSDELHQYFVPMRTPCIIDLIYDSIGAIIGQKFFKG